MTSDELLERLNAQACTPVGRIITARMVEDWVYERLIPGPIRGLGTRAPNWQWSEESFDAALKVVEYRERGFKRATAIRAQGWLEQQSFFSDVIPRKDLIAEFTRARNLLIRNVSSTHGLRMDAMLSEYKRRALLRQLGPLDSRFERAGINSGGATFILIYEYARFGEQITPVDGKKEPLAAMLAKALLPNGLHICAGLLETDETHPISAVNAVRNLSSKQLEKCRIVMADAPLMLAVAQIFIMTSITDANKKNTIEAAYSAARNTITQKWPWMIFAFVFLANIVYNSTLQKPI